MYMYIYIYVYIYISGHVDVQGHIICKHQVGASGLYRLYRLWLPGDIQRGAGPELMIIQIKGYDAQSNGTLNLKP